MNNAGTRHWRQLAATVILSLCQCAPAVATENDPGIWAIFSTKGNFRRDATDTRWLYHVDAQARYFDLGSGVNQWLVKQNGANLGDSA